MVLNQKEKKAIEILDTFELRKKTKNYKEISLEDTQSVKIVLNLIEKLVNENNRLVQDNLDLDRLYRRTAEKLKENGKEELANYFLAQIGAVPTWSTFEEYKHWINKDIFLEKIESVNSAMFFLPQYMHFEFDKNSRKDILVLDSFESNFKYYFGINFDDFMQMRAIQLR